MSSIPGHASNLEISRATLAQFHPTAVPIMLHVRMHVFSWLNLRAVVAGMQEYLTDATFRDPTNFQLKTLDDLTTIDDVWLWHYYVLAPKVYTSRYYNGAQQQGKDRGTILTFNRLTTGFRMVSTSTRGS